MNILNAKTNSRGKAKESAAVVAAAAAIPKSNYVLSKSVVVFIAHCNLKYDLQSRIL